MSRIEVDLLSDVINCPVLQFPGRHFPGILVQGDSLKAMTDLANEIAELISARDLKEALAVADELRCLLASRLDIYERALKLNGLAPPYTSSS